MKLTEHKRQWVDTKITHYCSLLQIEKPAVFLTMSEYNHWKVQERIKTGFSRVGRTQCLGVCHRENKFIVILVKRALNLAGLDNIIRHELIHYAKPSYNHRSKEFQDRLKRLKQGKLVNGRFV